MYVRLCPLAPPDHTDMSQCQRNSILLQLLNGIRYLDVRLQYAPGGKSSLCHSVCCMPLADFNRELREFVDGHASEIVIVHSHRGIFGLSDNRDEAAAQQNEVVPAVVDGIGRERVANRLFTAGSLVNAFMDAGVNVVMVFPDESVSRRHNIWDESQSLTRHWPASENVRDVLNFAKELWRKRDDFSKLHVAELILSPKDTSIVAAAAAGLATGVPLGIVGSYLCKGLADYYVPQTIMGFCRQLTESVPDFLHHCWVTSSDDIFENINIIMIDDCDMQSGAIIKRIVQVNLDKIPLTNGPYVISTSSSNETAGDCCT